MVCLPVNMREGIPSPEPDEAEPIMSESDDLGDACLWLQHDASHFGLLWAWRFCRNVSPCLGRMDAKSRALGDH